MEGWVGSLGCGMDGEDAAWHGRVGSDGRAQGAAQRKAGHSAWHTRNRRVPVLSVVGSQVWQCSRAKRSVEGRGEVYTDCGGPSGRQQLGRRNVGPGDWSWGRSWPRFSLEPMSLLARPTLPQGLVHAVALVLPIHEAPQPAVLLLLLFKGRLLWLLRLPRLQLLRS